MKTLKKALALLLVLAMSLSLMSVAAFADDEIFNKPATVEEPAAEEETPAEETPEITAVEEAVAEAVATASEALETLASLSTDDAAPAEEIDASTEAIEAAAAESDLDTLSAIVEAAAASAKADAETAVAAAEKTQSASETLTQQLEENTFESVADETVYEAVDEESGEVYETTTGQVLVETAQAAANAAVAAAQNAETASENAANAADAAQYALENADEPATEEQQQIVDTAKEAAADAADKAETAKAAASEVEAVIETATATAEEAAEIVAKAADAAKDAAAAANNAAVAAKDAADTIAVIRNVDETHTEDEVSAAKSVVAEKVEKAVELAKVADEKAAIAKEAAERAKDVTLSGEEKAQAIKEAAAAAQEATAAANEAADAASEAAEAAYSLAEHKGWPFYSKVVTTKGVIVTARAQAGVFPKGTELTVADMTAEAFAEAVGVDASEVVTAVDINFWLGGAKIQPDTSKGLVDVTIEDPNAKAVPTAVKTVKDGETETLAVEVEDGVAMFEAEHFTPFGTLTNSSAVAQIQNGETITEYTTLGEAADALASAGTGAKIWFPLHGYTFTKNGDGFWYTDSSERMILLTVATDGSASASTTFYVNGGDTAYDLQGVFLRSESRYEAGYTPQFLKNGDIVLFPNTDVFDFSGSIVDVYGDITFAGAGKNNTIIHSTKAAGYRWFRLYNRYLKNLEENIEYKFTFKNLTFDGSAEGANYNASKNAFVVTCYKIKIDVNNVTFKDFPGSVFSVWANDTLNTSGYSGTPNKQYPTKSDNAGVDIQLNSVTTENCGRLIHYDAAPYKGESATEYRYGYIKLNYDSDCVFNGQTTPTYDFNENTAYDQENCWLNGVDVRKSPVKIAETGVGYATLAAAVAAATNGQTVTLLKDVTLSDRVSINGTVDSPEDKAITLNMNNHNISGTGRLTLCGGSLTITGKGTISTAGSGLAPVEVRYTGSPESKRTLVIGDDVTLDGTGSGYGLNIFGTNNATANKIDVTVNGTVKSVIFVLGNLTNTGNEINITVNGKVESTKTGIALNGCANVTVAGNVTGTTGVEVRAGKLTVTNGGQITATGTPTSVSSNGSGTTSTGAGIAVSQHTTKLPINVTVSGGTINGYSAFYESNPQNNSTDDLAKVALSITGGTFNTTEGGTAAIYSQNKTAFITGGVFSTNPDAKYIATGYAAYPTVGASTYTVRPTSGYTVTWNNWNGTALETDSGVTYGTTPAYNGSTPTRPDSGSYYYVFTGWSPSVSAVTGDAAYTAQFAQYEYSSDSDDDDDTPVTTTPQQTTTIEEEATPLAALPENLAEVTVAMVDAETGETVEVAVSELPNVFVDVAEDSYARDAIAYAAALGLMNGVGSNADGEATFAPTAATTGDMLATILYRATSGETTSGENWAEAATAWAADNNLAEGMGIEELSQLEVVSREQMVTVMYRVAEARGFDVSFANDLVKFNDANELSDYARVAMEWAVSVGLIKGTSKTTLSPTDDVTREQIALILMRFNELTKDVV